MTEQRTREFRNRVIREVFNKDTFRLVPGNNLVLVKVYHDTEKTPGGLYVGDRQWNPANHAERVFEIVQVPEKLRFDPKAGEESMPWLTDIEIKVGDIAWCDYLRALNCWRFEYEGQEYRTIPYSSIYVVKRKKAIIPCNGYCLFEPYYRYKKVLNYIKKEVDPRFGLVRYVGKPNKDYRHRRAYNKRVKASWADEGYDIKPGDLVIFDKAEKLAVMLESIEHAMFDGKNMYRVAQRHRLLAILGQN